MKFIDYAGETIALLLAQPNWAVRPKCTATLPFTSIDKAISARESRRNFGRSSRYLLEYTPRFSGAEKSTEFRIGLARLIEETVAVPLWLDSIVISSAVAIGATTINKTSVMPARYGAEWIILSADLATYEIVTVIAITDNSITINSGAARAWPAGTLMYPLLFGRFEERPSLESITPQTIEGGLQIRENSSFARRINPVAGSIPAVGAGVPAFSTVPLWNFEPEWSQMLDTTEIDILYQQIGFLRTDQSYTAQQTVRRGLEMGFVCKSRSAIAAIERMFTDRRGPVRPSMVPTFRADLVPTADVPVAGNTTRINIASSEYSDPDRPPHPGDPYVAFVEPGDGHVDPQKITAVAGTALTTAVAIAQTHLARTTRLSFLLLARFAEPQLSWDYVTPQRAHVRIKFLEVADEYVTPNPYLKEPAYLFEWSEMMPTPLVSRFTSYENAISYGGNTWTPAPYSHDTISKRHQARSRGNGHRSWGKDFPANPLKKFFPYALEGELWLKIVEVNSAAPDDGSAKVLFYGIVSKPDFTGVDWKAVVRAFGNFFERNVPRLILRKTSSVPIYSPKSGVNKADLVVTGTIAAMNTTDKSVDITTGATPPANYFGGGGLFETGTGANWEQRTILYSVAITGGQRLTLNRALRKAVLTQAANMYPGWNGAIDTLAEVFGDDAVLNLRAFPFMPLKNPSANIGEVSTSAGGKKG